MNTLNVILLCFTALLSVTAARNGTDESDPPRRLRKVAHFKIPKEGWLQDMLEMINAFRKDNNAEPLCINS
jgi:uncharacterized protein YkwD